MQTKDLVINKFQTGIGESPYVGFGRMQNVEIFLTPGTIRNKWRNTLAYSTTGLPIAIVKDQYGNVYAGTEFGTIYKNGTVLQTGRNRVCDMKIWNNYLFITCDTTLDLYGPLNSGPAYIPAWSTPTAVTLATGYNHPILALPGNTMYLGNGQNIATITNFVAGVGGASPTATWNPTAVPLQVNEYCRTLANLGRNILIGTQSGSNSYDLNNSIANIYPYDLGTLTLGFPLAFEENGINQIFVVNNQAYVHAGVYGNIYVTNGSSLQFFKKLPWNTNRVQGTSVFPYPNAINYFNNELLIGTSSGGDTYTYLGSSSAHGIYSIKNKATVFKTISTSNVGTNQVLKIGAILPTGQDQMYVGWQDGSTYGVDQIDYRMPADQSSFFESAFMKVGTALDNKTYQDIEVQLTRPLVSGQTITLKWRPDLTTPFTTITTFTAPADNSNVLYAKALINNANTMQIRCEMSQPTTSSSSSVIEILEIRLR